MSLTEAAEKVPQDEDTRLRNIRQNEALLDMATGQDRVPAPLAETSPLVSSLDEKTERPYAR